MALCINFVSCGDNEGEGGNIDPANTTKRITNFTKETESYSYTCSLGYDSKNKVSDISRKGTENIYTEAYAFTFSNNETVATSEEQYGSYTFIDNIKFSLNGNGFCTSATWTAIEKNDTFYEENSDHYTFTYNSDNQLTKAEINGNTEEYIYKNGVMASSDVAETITYTDIPNIGNLFVALTTNYDDPFEEWRLAGLLGKASKFLPKTAAWDEGTETYDYELDEDGYVKTVKITFRDTKGNERTYSYKYTYENVK